MTRNSDNDYIQVSIRLPPGAVVWIDHLVDQGFWGRNRSQVARALMIARLAELTADGMADPAKFKKAIET